MDLLKNIVDETPVGYALMGMDVGKKTIGIALCDSSHSIATPLCTIKRTKFKRDIEAISTIIRDYNVGGYILGYPLNMNNSAGQRAQSVRDFGLEFINQMPLDIKSINGGDPWVALWDERLSTYCVEDFVDNVVGINKRRAKEKGIIDKLAAQHILQGALDYMRGKSLQ